MLKNYAVAFLFCLISSIANAQPIIDLVKEIKCSDVSVIMSYFNNNFQERPIWVGQTVTGTYITLLVNREKHTWTMIEYDAKLGCVLGAGKTSSSPEI